MKIIDQSVVKKLYRPAKNSHKGQNGKLMIVGGSKLFHGASLWALKVATRIVDMVYYSSVPENFDILQRLKSEIFDFICVPREEIDDYINEADAVLIGPGMTRENKNLKIKDKKQKLNIKNCSKDKDNINWNDTYQVTKYLLLKYPEKKWVIDAGALQMMEAEWLERLDEVIITPHGRELGSLFKLKTQNSNVKTTTQNLKLKAQEFGCTIVLKGPEDVICSPSECMINKTGNEGMTKGGTGDVLAGLIAAFACKNDLFVSAAAGTYINGLAGDRLYKKVGPYFNASDLCDEIPKVLGEI